MQKRTFIFTMIMLCITAIWIWGISPELSKLPKNFSLTADVVSVDNFYNEETKEFSGKQYSKTKYQYQVVSVDTDVLTIKHIFDVRTLDGQPIFSTERLYGIDRATGAHISTAGDKKRVGYLFAPEHLSKGESFTYWHINYDLPAQMTFVKEERLYGLRVLRYETNYKNQHVDQTENLTFLPGVGETRGVELEPYLEIWVEPVTGQLVKYQDATTAYYYDLKTHARLAPWNQFSNSFKDESVRERVETITTQKTNRQIINLYVPIFLLALIVLNLLRKSRVSDYVKRNSFSILHFFLPLSISLCGLLVIAGWIFDIPLLVQIIPGATGMNPVTAFCFCILGIALVLKNRYNGWLTVCLGGVITGIACLRVVSYLGISSFAIDQVLFAEKLLITHAQMGIFTALAFLSFGVILLISNSVTLRRLYLVELLTGWVFLMALMVLVGYVFKPLDILLNILFFNVAIHTAILMTFSSGIIFSLFRNTTKIFSLKNIGIIAGIMFVTLLLTLVTAGFVSKSFTENARASFEVHIENTKILIENRLHIYENALVGGKGLFVSSDEVERDEWKSYVSSLDIQKNYPGIQGMGYIAIVPGVERDTHVTKIRAEGFPDYSIVPSAQRSVYTPVVYVEPFDARNQQAFGFDLSSESTRKLGLEQARDTGNPSVTGAITLVQETDNDVQRGFLMYVPLYRNNTAQTITERRKSIYGYVYSPFRARDFMQGIIGVDGLKEIGLRVNVGTDISSANELYNDTDKKIKKSETPRFSQIKTLTIGGKSWTLLFSSTSEYGKSTFSRFVPPIIILFGFSLGVLVSFLFYSLVNSRQKALSYVQKVTKDLQQTNEALKNSEKEISMQMKNTEQLNVELKKSQMAMTNVLVDIEEEKKKVEETVIQRTKELRNEKARLLSSINSISFSFIIADMEDRIILKNKAMLALFGLDEKQEVTIEDISKILGEHINVKDEIQRCTTDKKICEIKEIIFGTKFLRGIIAPIIDTGDSAVTIGYVLLFEDITEAKVIERSREEFFAVASHELRTPLTAIRGNMSTIKDFGDTIDEKEKKEMINDAYDASVRLIGIVNDFLDTSRLEQGKTTFKKEKIDILPLIRETCDDLDELAKKKSLTLAFIEPVSALPLVLADGVRIKQAISNFIDNAIKYTEKGGVTVSVEQEGQSVSILVRDTGKGISPENQSLLFRKFQQAGEEMLTRDVSKSTGLGLYITKLVVEAMGGTVSLAKSTQGEGSTFKLTIPLAL